MNGTTREAVLLLTLIGSTAMPMAFAADCADGKDEACQDAKSTVSKESATGHQTTRTIDFARKNTIDSAKVESNLLYVDNLPAKVELKAGVYDQLKLNLGTECSPLRWTEERIVELDREIVVDPDERGATAGVSGAYGMEVPAPVSSYGTVGAGMNVLTEIETSRPVSIILNTGIRHNTAQLIGSLPANLLFDQLNGQMAIYTPCRGGLQTNLPHPAITTGFQIRLHTGSTPVDLDVVLPVTLSTPALVTRMYPGVNVDAELEYSGGPLSCAGLPSQVPCGPVSWTYQQTVGGALPQGVVLDTLGSGNARLHGAVHPHAYSSAGKFHLSQQARQFQTDASFEVPVSLTEAQRLGLAEVRSVVRGDLVEVQLPQPSGGDGSNYQWRYEYNSDLPPSGLQLSGDRITGTVADLAELGDRDIRLIVSSSINHPSMRFPETNAQMWFHLTAPFKLWTQNTFLRPPDLPQVVHDAASTTSNIVSTIIGDLLCGLPCAIGGLLTSEALEGELARAIESGYDNSVQNTVADNAQRTAAVLARIASENYDVVALQEVFQFDPALNGGVTLAHVTQLATGAAPTFDQIDGPPPAGIEMNSGLSVLARRSLASMPNYAHAHDVYQNDPLLVTVNGNPEFNFDGLSQKGMTIDRIQLGPNPDEFFFIVNTHMQAEAGPVFAALRAAQQVELDTFIRTFADTAHPVVIVGDMNVTEATGSGLTRLQTGSYFGMLSRLGLSPADDLYRMHQNQAGNADGFTIDTSRNLYAQNWGGGGNPQRLDYILVRQGTRFELRADRVEMTDFVVPTTQCGLFPASPPRACYLSDHYGLEADLRLVRP